MSGRPLVTVVVTTKDSLRTIGRCLDSILAQDYAPLEIVAVDNFSTDGTFEAIRDRVDLALSAGPERCTQRNLAIARARGEYVLIVDSDMELEPNVVSRALAACVVGVNAVGIPEQSFGEGFWSRCKILERDGYRADRLLSGARFFPVAVLRSIGGFDEHLVSGEDWDLVIRATVSGRYAFADATIRHDEGTLTLAGLMRKKYYYGRFLPRFIAKHGRAALVRLSPLRVSLLRSLSALRTDPRLVVGVFAMKAAEATAGLAGMLVGGAEQVLQKR
jgi:glycosyltransferase involved in cell wall biosynthesis